MTMTKASSKVDQVDELDKLLLESTQIITDDSKEIITHKLKVADKEKFFLVYASLLSKFTDIGIVAVRTYAYLLLNYLPGRTIIINNIIKNEIKEFMNNSAKGYTTLDLAIKELVASDLLQKSYDPDTKTFRRSSYIINPKYAFYGNSSERRKALVSTFEIEYELSEGEMF